MYVERSATNSASILDHFSKWIKDLNIKPATLNLVDPFSTSLKDHHRRKGRKMTRVRSQRGPDHNSVFWTIQDHRTNDTYELTATVVDYIRPA